MPLELFTLMQVIQDVEAMWLNLALMCDIAHGQLKRLSRVPPGMN